MNEILVRIEKEGPCATVVIDRPRALNALNAEVLRQLKEAFETLGKDPEVRGIVLTGAGDRAFVAGADIAYMADLSPEQGKRFAESGLDALRAVEHCPVPVVAAVNGYALGGGLELALACDMIYATPNALLGQPEVGLGIIPGFGGTQRLARLVGRNRAKELILTGRRIDAAKARDYGIVQEIVAQEDLLRYCREVVLEISRQAPLAVAQAKLAVNEGVDLAIESGLTVEKLAFSSLFASRDQKEGMKAFVEKRKPEFTGN